MLPFLRGFALLVLTGALVPSALAADLSLSVSDGEGAPLADAVVSLAGPAAGASTGVPLRANMDQRDKMFFPHVLAVRTGTAVTFPNSDDIRHQVYSFSSSKRFELRLYEGTPTAPVVFDQPGVVVLGCNIHDWMLGYVYVTPDPWFAVTDGQGKVKFSHLAEGTYSVTLWHPKVADLQPQAADTLTLGAASAAKAYTLAVAPSDDDTPVPPTSPFGDAFGKALRENQK
ncbi:methylamine utilization protein [Pseudomonas sp. Marseille-Q5115]|uniref:methylamine utilization protein n=1 Tax=Pseudomonas sp. Marseille-Q5115 TaxID=2866593 RepID=UPI001CE3F96A|nr:methylamine utilization protein [Pseudomonas sp. Marseille-Q5115]